jgi:hypothetical protein
MSATQVLEKSANLEGFKDELKGLQMTESQLSEALQAFKLTEEIVQNLKFESPGEGNIVSLYDNLTSENKEAMRGLFESGAFVVGDPASQGFLQKIANRFEVSSMRWDTEVHVRENNEMLN